ncbi:MAG: LCP family protein [Chloroflexi bacterium]|nr:LCP family protein [Chloroflexota bacterium]MBV9896511.1 LCP family protein [Chloroflexota bacterium]
MIRVAGLLLGVALGALMLLFGLALMLRLLLPDWYAVPGALMQMTGQRVPAVSPPPAPVVQLEYDESSFGTPDPPTPGVRNMPADSASPTPTVEPANAETPVAEVESGDAAGTLLPNRRFNVLLLGSDNDLKFSPNAVLTQAMILVSIDPANADVAMISIPRDFWVPIAGYGNQKIDVAYEVGGIALARSTVERLFGVKIDYYAWVGLNGLVQVIDTLGGVDVTVQHPILDETYPDDLNSTDPYAFFRLYIPAGPQHLDGTTALEYVRSRHGDLQSDFGRSARQQQVLVAIKNRVQTLSVVGHVPRLVAALQGSVKTDLTLADILQLAALAHKVPAGSIHQQVLAAPDFASLGYSPDGTQQVVFPNWAAIRPVVTRMLRPASAAAGPMSGT